MNVKHYLRIDLIIIIIIFLGSFQIFVSRVVFKKANSTLTEIRWALTQDWRPWNLLKWLIVALSLLGSCGQETYFFTLTQQYMPKSFWGHVRYVIQMHLYIGIGFV